MRPFTAIAFLLILLTFLPMLGCGNISSTTGSILFVPESVSLTVNSFALGTQTILVNIRDVDGDPIQGSPVKMHMLQHGHQPFAGATGEVAFINENGIIDIPSPDGSNIPGTVLEGTTDANGNFTFTIQFPFGASYVINVVCFAARTTATFVLTLTADTGEEGS